MTRSDIYGIANVYYEFLDGSSVDVSVTRLANAGDRLWGGIGAGGTFSWNSDRYALFGEVSYNTSLDDVGDSYSYKGTAGFRLRW
jgi:outer membrane autotransporter protein